MCDGDFNVNASDICADVKQVTIKVKEIPVGAACIDKALTAPYFSTENWLVTVSTPLWVEYEALGESGGKAYFYKSQHPFLYKFSGLCCVTSDGETCTSASSVSFITIGEGVWNDEPVWELQSYALINVQEIEPFCDEC